ncbi:MAG: LytR C-terminal domain-containing protein [bacterium]|nr:LytR C-terminal domain-containing protein [bacterium]
MAKKTTTNKKEVASAVEKAPTSLVVAWVGIGLLITIILVGVVIGPLRLKQSATEAPSVEMSLLEKIGRHIAIPTDEDPTIARVEDVESMRQNNPTFYENASEGDALVVWSNLAVLYSEDKDLVLSVLPLELGSADKVIVEKKDEAEIAVDLLKNEQELVKIEVLNGTYVAGLARVANDSLEEQGFTTMRPRDARHKGYEKSIIIKRIDQDLPEIMSLLQEQFGAEVVDLPEAETIINGDIIVILGSNYPLE